MGSRPRSKGRSRLFTSGDVDGWSPGRRSGPWVDRVEEREDVRWAGVARVVLGIRPWVGPSSGGGVDRGRDSRRRLYGARGGGAVRGGDAVRGRGGVCGAETVSGPARKSCPDTGRPRRRRPCGRRAVSSGGGEWSRERATRRSGAEKTPGVTRRPGLLVTTVTWGASAPGPWPPSPSSRPSAAFSRDRSGAGGALGSPEPQALGVVPQLTALDPRSPPDLAIPTSHERSLVREPLIGLRRTSFGIAAMHGERTDLRPHLQAGAFGLTTGQPLAHGKS